MAFGAPGQGIAGDECEGDCEQGEDTGHWTVPVRAHAAILAGMRPETPPGGSVPASAPAMGGLSHTVPH
ncbi:hypothetical protein GCM10011394_05190 [Luteimonas terricola]|uniref:Uncharacterized protein n=1 Tax=Luteimonas terricola TaxID=645597 RepID=A0ABQ2E7B6_9GAMM|nr:hypothetical protein GCM10011394_05190 [Luteimonas terricola]